MPGFIKVIGSVLAGILGLALLAAATVWLFGEAVINKKYAAPEINVTHSDDPAVIAEGERLSIIAGCTGCHEERLQGGVLAALPDGSLLVAPNLPRLAGSYSDGDLARAIRYGVKQNGKGVSAMPSEIYFAFTDDDLGRIISYIRATPDEGAELPELRIGLLVRFFLGVTRDFKLAPELIGDMAARPVYDFDKPVERGEYLARIACAECHGLDFKGGEEFEGVTPPDLIVGAAYTPEQFKHLMTTGGAIGERDLGMMSEVAQLRFSKFTDEEIGALHEFLKHRAMNAQ